MRFLMIWEQGGGWGHIGRIAPLARGLLCRGHEVVLAVQDPERVAARLPGARVLPLPAVAHPPARPRLPMADYSDLLFNIGWHGDAELRRLTEAWLTLFDALAPAADVIEHSPTALLAAQARRRACLLHRIHRCRTCRCCPACCRMVLAAAEDRRAAEAELVARASRWLVGLTRSTISTDLARVKWTSRPIAGAGSPWPRATVEYAGVACPIGSRLDCPRARGSSYLKDFPARRAPAHAPVLRAARAGLPARCDSAARNG
jgi:hypothetical protein